MVTLAQLIQKLADQIPDEIRFLIKSEVARVQEMDLGARQLFAVSECPSDCK
jgi:hypothetical protein